MSVNSVQGAHSAAQGQAVSQAQATQKQANLQNAFPQDTVTISAAAQAKQTAASIGADGDHDGK